MTVWHLAWKEIRHRKFNFAMAILSVTVAVGCMIGAWTLLSAHDRRTEAILQEKENETRKKMQAMKKDVDKALRRLGFNLVILPKRQKLDDWYADDYAAEFMPEQYVARLADSKVVVVQRIVPRLRAKIFWPETKWTVILVGTGAEVSLPSNGSSETLLESVAPGTVLLGYEIHSGLKLKAGRKIRLMKKEFTVAKCLNERGVKDDMTIWMNLRDAQALLGKTGFVNEILALECRSVWADLPKVRRKIAAILPDTNVIERASQTLARAEAYDKVAREARAAVEREKAHRLKLRAEMKNTASVLVPLVLAVCVAWIALLTFKNVRDRRSEIGLLRAVGFRGGQILVLFLSRSVLVGLLGGVFGFAAGRLLGARLGGAPASSAMGRFYGAELASLMLAVLLATALSVVSGWVPARLAARQDPAEILREE